jgi:hypothetical protein
MGEASSPRTAGRTMAGRGTGHPEMRFVNRAHKDPRHETAGSDSSVEVLAHRVNHSWRGQSGAGRWWDVERVIQSNVSITVGHRGAHLVGAQG